MCKFTPLVEACHSNNFSAAKRAIVTAQPLDYTLCQQGQSAVVTIILGIKDANEFGSSSSAGHTRSALRILRLLLKAGFWRPGCNVSEFGAEERKSFREFAVEEGFPDVAKAVSGLRRLRRVR